MKTKKATWNCGKKNGRLKDDVAMSDDEGEIKNWGKKEECKSKENKNGKKKLYMESFRKRRRERKP